MSKPSPQTQFDPPQIPTIRGAVFVETLIILPVFMVIVFLLFWMSYLSFAKYTLANSVNTGVLAAVTRGDADVYSCGVPSIAGISRYANDQNRYSDKARSWDPNLNQLITNMEDCSNPIEIYNQWMQASGSSINASLQAYPPQALHALIYTLELFRTSLGGALVRFPCDPDLPGPENGLGCLRCQVMNAMEMQAIVTSGSETSLTCPTYEEDRFGGQQVCLDRIGIKCTYAPTGLILASILGFLGADPTQNVFKISYQSWSHLSERANPTSPLESDVSGDE